MNKIKNENKLKNKKLNKYNIHKPETEESILEIIIFLIYIWQRNWVFVTNSNYLIPIIYWIWCCRLLIFQTKISWCNRIHSLKYLRSTTLGCRDIGIRKSEFVKSVRSINLSLKYQSFTTSGWKDIGIRNFEFVAKTNFFASICLNGMSSLHFCNTCIWKCIYILIFL